MIALTHEIRVTDKITLSHLTENDFDDLVTQINDPVIFANTLTVPHPYTQEHARSFLTHVREFEEQEEMRKDWVIRFDGRLIGGIGALYNYGVRSHKTEIGYWLGKDFRKRGIMSQVIGVFSHHLFMHTPLIRLEAHVFLGNDPSAHALERNGYILEGIARAAFVKNGEPRDSWQYALLAPHLRMSPG